MPADDSSQPSANLRFLRSLRLTRSSDFDRVFELRCKAADSRLVLFLAPNQLPHARMGLSVSRRHGNSVVRHRLRRRMREAFRLEQHQLVAGLDYVLVPGREAVTATMDELRQSLCGLARKAARRLSDPPR